ncbi:hypothetical protein BG32_07245 [Mesotoga sp. HF07.pep.5.2.highcov]|uniref:DUF4433 domain-containing protein n=1 Tax=Mesotoga TaxID=1184396 RepID=UPI000EF17092|nr:MULTISPECIES: DUF4433 domain-containing protein [Mesotoga]RLL92035.1 hypothetical protein BG32_07245 [Mesotoga sp. HF07.pep.5.2.highcov]HPE54143.1 DUF4433 domain-containing protein [Mesotoga prima]HRX65762.1 DUF4433 domain-containing protein [Mesotoga sp.]
MVTSSNPLQAFGVKHLYYLSPVKNIPSILEHGVMSKMAVETLEIPYDDYSDQTVQTIRERKSLHEYVPLFFNTRNAMTFRYQKEKRDFAILRLNSDLVTHYDCLVSDRIAACSDAEIYVLSEAALKKINIEVVLSARNFYDNWLLKKRLGAEILVKTDMIEPEWIECIILDRNAEKINGVSIRQLRDSGSNYYF